jgi:hypothetical protein
MDGGFDVYGVEAAPSSVGTVYVDFTLIAEVEMGRYGAASYDEGLQRAFDTLGELANFGQKRLFLTPYLGATERFCWAKINNISISKQPSEALHFHQNVGVIFQVASPYWYTRGTESWQWGDGTTWGGGAKWGGNATPHAVSGLSTSFTETISGNAYTSPRITIECGAGQTAEDVTVQRLENGIIRDEVKYTGVLSAGDSLEINCRAKSVKLNGSAAYEGFTATRQDVWFRLFPSANSIKVLMKNAGDAASITLRYYEVYR